MRLKKGEEEEGRPPSPENFPRKSVLIERPRKAAMKADRIRMLLMHDNHSRILGLIGRSSTDQEAVAEMLTDRFAGIGNLAAGEYITAARKRMDIERSVPKLMEALGSPYTRVNAAFALARHFLNSDDTERLGHLLAHPDRAVAGAAREAMSEDEAEKA